MPGGLEATWQDGNTGPWPTESRQELPILQLAPIPFPDFFPKHHSAFQLEAKSSHAMIPVSQFTVLTVSRPRVSAISTHHPRAFYKERTAEKSGRAFHDTSGMRKGFFALHSRDEINELRGVDGSSTHERTMDGICSFSGGILEAS
jgi:hypothetical protein